MLLLALKVAEALFHHLRLAIDERQVRKFANDSLEFQHVFGL